MNMINFIMSNVATVELKGFSHLTLELEAKPTNIQVTKGRKRIHNIKKTLILLVLSILYSCSDARIGKQEITSNERILNDHDSSSEIHQIETSDSFIVGGYRVNSPETYPYIVSIMEVDIWTKRALHSCAGTLIAPDVVLTAAHCVDYSAYRVVDTGRFSWYDDDDVEAFQVAKVYIHPEFDANFFLNDVALLKLSGKAVAKFAHLHKGENFIDIGDIFTSVGWGLTSDGGFPSPDLRAVEVKVISTFECQMHYGKFITDTMICAYGYGKDACQGDSGGPAIHTDSSGITQQVGIISWGDSCGKNPGVYTNLESPVIMNFINQVMCQSLVPGSCDNGIFYGIQNTTNNTATENTEDTEMEDTGVEISKIEMNDTKVEISKIEMNDTNTEISEIEVNGTQVSETEPILKVDLCKNSDISYCKWIKTMPWFGCTFSKIKCPEICCLSCDPDKGCIN